MNQLFSQIFPLLGATEQGASSSDPMSMVMSFAPIVLIIIIFYFLLIRPQNKKQKEMERMIREMTKGDTVVTIGGLHGSVDSIGDTFVIIRADENVKLKFSKSAIATVTRVGGKSDE